VQVAGDAGALLGDRELPLPRGLLFGEDGALAEFGHLLAAQPGAFAREPRGGVGEAGVDQVAARQAEGRHARTEIRDEQDHHGAGAARRPRRRVVAAAGEQVQRRRRSQRRPDHEAGRGQQDARRHGQREDPQRGSPPRDQGHGRQRHQHHAGRVGAARPGVDHPGEAAAVSDERERAGQRRGRDRDVG